MLQSETSDAASGPSQRVSPPLSSALVIGLKSWIGAGRLHGPTLQPHARPTAYKPG